MTKLALLVVSFALFLTCAGTVRAQSQSEMNATAAADFAKVDKRLNIVYKKILESLDDQGKKLLVASQRAWVAFRDAEADFEADSTARGGTMAPLIYSTTRSEVTEARIKQLLDTYAIDNEEEAKKLGWKAPKK